MGCYITITDISGTPPYTITICDNNGNNCFVAAYELSYVPPTIYVNIPESWSTLPFVQLNIQSSEGCEQFSFINNTPTPTPTVTPTQPLGSPTMTPTLTTTPTPTLSPIPLNPPYFEVQNIVGTNPMSVQFQIAAVSSFDYNWGDGTGLNSFTKSSGPTTAYTFTNTYASSTYTARFNNFKSGSTLSTNKFTSIVLTNISNIVENEYTFSAFTGTTTLAINQSQLSDFSSSLPTSLQNFNIFNTNGPGATNFSLTPTTDYSTLTNLQTIQVQSCDLLEFNASLSGCNNFETLRLVSNSSLSAVTITIPTGSTFQDMLTFGNDISSLNYNPPIVNCSNLQTLRLNSNNLSTFTYDLPISLQEFYINQNILTDFNVDLTPNFNLDLFHIFTNQLTSFTNSVSACTSLTELRLDGNFLSSAPPVLPNSLQTLYLTNNVITGYTSNFPTSMQNFRISDGANGVQYIPQWTVELTGATNLFEFRIESVGLTGWTTNFPSGTDFVYMGGNEIYDFDFKYMSGVTNTINLNDNNLTGVTNLSACTSLVTLDLSGNNFKDGSNIIQGNFPSSLRTIKFGGTSTLTGWTESFSGMTNLLSLDFRNTNLKTAAVNYILQDVAVIATANTLYNKTLLLSGTSANQPESPTGGVTNQYYLLLKNSPYSWTITVKP